MVTYQHYAKIRDEKGLSDGRVASKANIGRSTFSDWKSGRSEPKGDKLVKIADALGVPYSRLVGNYGKFSRYNPNRPKPRELSEEEKFDAELCRLYHNATSDAQNSVMTLLKNSQKDGSKSSKEA